MAHRQPTFHVIELTKPPIDAEKRSEWFAVAEKFRSLRLRALETAPEAFASSCEIESQRGLDKTFERLKTPKAHQFVAVESDDTKSFSVASADIANICKYEWVGMVVILGPMEVDVHAREDPYKQMVGAHRNADTAPESSGRSRRSSPKEFVLNGVFVEPSVRGKGVGRALIETAVKMVQGHNTPRDYALSMTALVHVENSEARKLYESAGFVGVGEETYRQEPRALLGESQVVEKGVLKMRKTVALGGQCHVR